MNELGISGTVVGTMTASFAISQFLVSPLSGKAVDRFGRKPVLVLGLFLFGISEFIFGCGDKRRRIVHLARPGRHQRGLHHAGCHRLHRGYHNN